MLHPLVLVLGGLLVGATLPAEVLAGPATQGAGSEPQGEVASQDDGLPGAKVLDPEALRDALGRAEALPEDAPQRAQLIEAYTGALNALEARDLQQAEAETLQEQAKAAPTRIVEAEAELEALRELPGPDPAVWEGLDLNALIAEETRTQIQSGELAAEAQRLDERLRTFAEERAQLSQERAQTAEDIEALEETLRQPSTAEESSELGLAQRASVRARLAWFEAKAERIRVEEATAGQRLERVQALARLATKKAERAEAERRLVESIVGQARVEAAERERESSRQALDAQLLLDASAFEGIVATVTELRNEAVEVARSTEEVRVARERLELDLGRLNERFKATESRIDNPSLKEATGVRLRQERRQLGQARAKIVGVTGLLSGLAQAELAQFRLDAKLEELDERRDLRSSLARVAEDVDGIPSDDASRLAGVVVSEYRTALVKARDARKTQIVALNDLEAERAEFALQIGRVEEFVAERVLWIRSSEPAWSVRAEALQAEARHALRPSEWRDFFVGVFVGRGDRSSDLQKRPWTYAGIAVGLLALVLARLRLGRMLAEEAELARQRSQISIGPTWRALVLSLLMAAPLGAGLYALAWLVDSIDASVFPDGGATVSARAYALARGLEHAALVAWVVGFFRVLVHPAGLAAAHFDWPESSLKRVGRQTVWLLPIGTVAAFLAHFLSNLEVGLAESSARLPFEFELDGLAFSEGFSRIALLVLLASFALYHVRVLHPSRGILALNAKSAVPNDVLTNLRRLWFVLGILVFGILALAAAFGYGFTARSLLTRLLMTVEFLVGVFVLRAIALRWTKLVRRREAFEKLRKRREEQRAKRLAEIERRRNAGEDVEDLESQGLEVEDQAVDVAALSSDVLGLVRVLTGLAAIVGAFWIWASVLPALGILDDVRLWQHDVLTAAIDGAEAGAASVTAEYVTLGNLFAALAILFLTYLAVRDLPSLVEIVILRRFQLGSGERYAASTLLRYTLTMIGVVWAFNEVGISWSKVQWLVAGVSVGLGFGLQEIFANFVSGITLLFERPVRVGDWVTLGEIEGVVSRIRIRATTIRDRDLKELVVPNREFITDRFINWTLSDPISRVKVTVGIAYGSDVERAIQLLLEAGRSSPFSVEEPAPNVIFKSFADSSLEFELRIFVTGREVWPRVIHDLHVRIDAAFRAAEIEIAFPQRDIHVRSVAEWPAPPAAAAEE